MSALLAGGVIGGSIIGAGSQHNTNEANQDFAREMSSTQYQRAVEDMRAAGINPVMAASNGGASSNGVQNTAPGAQIGNGIANAARLINETNQAEANIKQQNQNTAVAKQLENKTKEETKLVQANTAVQQANAKIQNAQVAKEETKGAAWGAVAPVAKDVAEGAKKGLTNVVTNPKGAWDRYTAPFRSQTPSDAYAAGRGTVYGGTHSATATTGKSH